MNPFLEIRGVRFSPPLFCAPMAGLTHSAFRRLLSDFGGYGAVFTEMLSGTWLLNENLRTSPAVKRRPQEGLVIYQLMISDPAQVPAVAGQLARISPCGIDLNCACPAPHIRAAGAGSELFEDRDRLAAILTALRERFTGPLTVKIRLGKPQDKWQAPLRDRLRLFEDCGLDAVTLHPRFTSEKLRRRARHELLGEIASWTRLPLIASGDILGPETIHARAHHFDAVAGLMLGRMAVVQPWIFAAWEGRKPAVDYLEIWLRYCQYAAEDFEPQYVLGRVRAFTAYYARNFMFGHTLFSAAQSARDLATLREQATEFLGHSPAPVTTPCIDSLA